MNSVVLLSRLSKRKVGIARLALTRILLDPKDKAIDSEFIASVFGISTRQAERIIKQAEEVEVVNTDE